MISTDNVYVGVCRMRKRQKKMAGIAGRVCRMRKKQKKMAGMTGRVRYMIFFFLFIIFVIN